VLRRQGEEIDAALGTRWRRGDLCSAAGCLRDYRTAAAGGTSIGNEYETVPDALASRPTRVGGSEVEGLGDFYHKVWTRGPAGVEIPIEIVRDGRAIGLRIRSADRSSFMKRPRLQ